MTNRCIRLKKTICVRSASTSAVSHVLLVNPMPAGLHNIQLALAGALARLTLTGAGELSGDNGAQKTSYTAEGDTPLSYSRPLPAVGVTLKSHRSLRRK